MLGNLKEIFFGKSFSKQTAKNRLQMVLVQDRSGLSPAEMDNFRKEIVDVISRYFTIDKKHVDVEWQRNDQTTALLINTPVVGRKAEMKKAAVATA